MISALNPVILANTIPPAAHEPDVVASLSLEVARFLSLGEHALSSYWNEGHVDALDRAVSSYRSALCQAGDGSVEKIQAQIGLSDALRLKVDEGTGDEVQGAEAMSLAESAVAAAACSSTVFPDALRALGEALVDVTRSRDEPMERLRTQRAVDTFRQLVDLTSESGLRDNKVVKYLALYSRTLNSQWRQTADAQLIELANCVVDRATTIHNGHGDGSAHEPDLAYASLISRHARFIIKGSSDDLDEAIRIGEEYISSCPQAYPRLIRFWIIMSVHYHHKTSSGGTLGGYEDRRFHACSEATKIVRAGHSLWISCHANYAAALYRQFISQSNLEALNEAIAISRNLVSKLAATGYADKNSFGIVINLSEYLTASYAQFGNLDALDEAVALQLGILDRVAAGFGQGMLKELGKAYRTRYGAHGRLDDLENAILMQEQALLCAGFGHYPMFREISNGLAESLLDRFDQRGLPEDLEKAISILRAAVDHPSPQQTHLGSVYSLLGHGLLKRGAASNIMEDVEDSIRCQDKALDLLAEGHSERSISYHRLGLAEYRAFMIDQRESSLQASLAAFNHALSLMAPDHPNRAAYLADLALSQTADARMTGQTELKAILRTLEDGAMHAHSSPSDRYAAAVMWASTAHQAGLLNTALHAYRLAISILPHVAWLGLEDELRMQRLAHQPSDISQDAAACAIELGLYEVAVEIIEGSRGILWNTSQELRADLGKLREVAPDLARELAQTNAALAFRAGTAQQGQDERARESERHRIHRLAARRTELLQTTRSLSGLENFLLPPSYETVRHVSRNGPVVILISSSYRCDALILQADTDVTLVSLPNVSHRVVLQQVQVLQYALKGARDRKGQQFLERVLVTVLRGLWNQIGRPIWSALKQQPASERHLTRLWWCPTGALTLLPIHACGPHNGVDSNMMDLVISSYTPTLSSLLRSQASANMTKSPQAPRLLVVCQPQALNRPALPCAWEEGCVLQSMLPSLCTLLIGSDATVSEVQNMLGSHNWLHVSSHGSQDGLNPLESSIALYDGELKLSDLAQARIPNAEFAFLSACHSAKGTNSLPDESMHLAAGMMFAGFKGVVATSWGIADKDAPVIARVFYGHLMKDGKTPMVADTAEALHFAVKHLRQSGVPLFRWTPFIHLGA